MCKVKQPLNNWSPADLEHEIKTDLYTRHSSVLTNYSDTMTLPQQKLAQEVMIYEKIIIFS